MDNVLGLSIIVEERLELTLENIWEMAANGCMPPVTKQLTFQQSTLHYHSVQDKLERTRPTGMFHLWSRLNQTVQFLYLSQMLKGLESLVTEPLMLRLQDSLLMLLDIRKENL